MNETRLESLRVAGATLTYEMRGSGPLLMMIAGGDGGSAGYDAVANQLANDFTVVTYHRRGSYRSTLDAPVDEMRLEQHSQDAALLLAALTSEPADVFGSSAGALIGLDLALRFPDQVRRLVAHEPPVEGILPEFDQFQAEFAEAIQREGPLVAMMKSMAQLGVNYASLEPGVELPRRDPRAAAGGGNAFRYTFPAVHHYRLDVAALAAARPEVVLAAGSASRGFPGYRVTAALAERLGKPLVEFPSHHAGYVSFPKAFAARLHQVLEEEQPGL